jgi:hypothetical protein
MHANTECISTWFNCKIILILQMGQSAMLEVNKKIKKFLQDPTKME